MLEIEVVLGGGIGVCVDWGGWGGDLLEGFCQFGEICYVGWV